MNILHALGDDDDENEHHHHRSAARLFIYRMFGMRIYGCVVLCCVHTSRMTHIHAKNHTQLIGTNFKWNSSE